ncbi:MULTISPECIES: response regulator [unclassified Spirosoma]|uniref:hybrid sensor histidine kinase/response regulator n=1 Tax=unclassified Spirosoma TaxID=2621999 RepID=UPI00096590B6|nr:MULTISPECIES: response regulator [unclassified Spirosoma]MBN8825190.1 response regulator [Spirosoma sp.]OJW77130.1 MAG: hybrid sensor histidine kinase/response regulator [Spirosoma sp. 48-14]
MATQILLIEDDVQIRENVEELLTSQGFQVETATNGREGITQAMLHLPDLILCDIMMPEVSGYQVLEVVRSNRLIANVPFIFLTAKSDTSDMRRGMDLGADDYLTKPFTFQNLLRTIESRLKREYMRKIDLKTQIDTFRHKLASVTAHEYNTALAGIIGISSLLLDDYQQLSDEETIEMMGMVKVSGLRLKRSLDNIQLMDILQQIDPSRTEAYAYFSKGSSCITAERVESLIEAVLYRLDRTIGYQLSIQSVSLRMSEDSLRICLEELIDNAFKFSNATQKVLLVGVCDDNQYRLTFTNTGQPFKACYHDQIAPYTQFDRQQYEQQGFGLGLAIVKRILELNQGQLCISSKSDDETTVSIWLQLDE